MTAMLTHLLLHQGVYMANQYLSQDAAMGKTAGGSSGHLIVETRITFNGGGHWDRIKAPKSFSHSSCNRCDMCRRCTQVRHSVVELSRISILRGEENSLLTHI